MFEENMTWSNAESTCQNYGGYLAYLEDDQSRSTCAKRALQTCFRDGPQIDMAYAGLTNIFDLTYRWVRDNSMTNLSSSQMLPLPPGSRYCSTFTDNTIGFVNCSLEYPFICERNIRKYSNHFLSFLVLLKSTPPMKVRRCSSTDRRSWCHHCSGATSGVVKETRRAS